MKSTKKIIIATICVLAIIAIIVTIAYVNKGKESMSSIPLDIQLGKTTMSEIAGQVTVDENDECDYVLNQIEGFLHFTKTGDVIDAVTFVCNTEKKAELVKYLGKKYGEKEDLYGYLEWRQEEITVSYLCVGEEAIAEWRLTE